LAEAVELKPNAKKVPNPGNLRGDPNQTPWEYKIIKLNYVKSNPKVYLVIAECKVYPALFYVISPSPLPTKNFTNHYHHRLVILVYRSASLYH